MNGTTGRQARRRRIDAMPVAMGILLAAGLLSGCGSDAGRIMLSPSEQPAAASSDAPSADGSPSAPSSFSSSSSSAETSPGTDSLDPAAIPSAPPARPSLGDHPCVLASAVGSATARKITCHPAKVQTWSGSASAPASADPGSARSASAGSDSVGSDSVGSGSANSGSSASAGAQGWSMERMPGPIRTYEFAPGAQVFVSSRLSGMPEVNDNDAARATWPQFVAYAHKRSADPLQVYIELDANDRILLLWEPHHP